MMAHAGSLLRFLVAGAWLLAATAPCATGGEPETNAARLLRKGDALLVRIQNVGGGIPEYREIVDSDGRIELPFIGFIRADGRALPEVAAEMAESYAAAFLASNADIQITWVTNFVPPPERKNLLRSQDPRQPVPAAPPPAAP